MLPTPTPCSDDDTGYVTKELLGAGQEFEGVIMRRSFGSVYVGERRIDGCSVAMKRIAKGFVEKSSFSEISAMKMCDSDFIVQYKDSFVDDTNCWVWPRFSVQDRSSWSIVSTGRRHPFCPSAERSRKRRFGTSWLAASLACCISTANASCIA